MVKTRKQATKGKDLPHQNVKTKASDKARAQPKKDAPDAAQPEVQVGSKRDAKDTEEGQLEVEDAVKEEPPTKRTKIDEEARDHPAKHQYQTGTIERGHIYFFYRPKVELEEAHDLDDVQRFHILLIPRPPEFAQPPETGNEKPQDLEEGEMTVLSPGADAVPAPETTDTSKKPFRLIAVGKKSLPDPEAGGGGKGGGRKQIFWATIVTVGEDLHKLEEGLGEKSYETQTRGVRHQGPARLAGRGAYAIVNADAKVPSARETHLGYHLSHPTPDDFGDVQKVLGIHPASSFIVQVKNPLAPNTGGARVGLPTSKRAEFPEYIMSEVFGAGDAPEHKGREKYGLRFTSVERREMLDFEGAELLFIAARSGEEGLNTSLGEGRGEALKEVEEKEGHSSIQNVLNELAMDSEKIPAEPLKGEWI